jgi:AcrR family transcriptional regulator
VAIGARLFAERPFNDVWIEEVAREAGVSRGLVYHYFPNKRDFYAAIVRHGMRDAFELTSPDPSLPPERWLPDAVERVLDYVAANADAFRAVYAGRHSSDEEVREAIRENRAAQVERICSLISPAAPTTQTLRFGIEGWIAMLDAMLVEWIDGRGIERERLVELACGSLVGTITAAMQVDGNAERIDRLPPLVPDTFSGD